MAVRSETFHVLRFTSRERPLSGSCKVRRDRLTKHAVFVRPQRGEKSLAKYGKSLLGLARIKKPVGRDRLTNLLNS